MTISDTHDGVSPISAGIAQSNFQGDSMTIRELTAPKIRLNVPVGSPSLTMDLDQFFEFNFWLAEELLDLEAKNDHWRTPNSNPLPTYDANGLPDELKIDFESC